MFVQNVVAVALNDVQCEEDMRAAHVVRVDPNAVSSAVDRVVMHEAFLDVDTQEVDGVHVALVLAFLFQEEEVVVVASFSNAVL